MNTNYLALFLFTLFLSSCTSDCENYECELDTESVAEMINSYHDISSNKNAETIDNDHINFYIDITYGTNWALRDEKSESFFKSFLSAQNFSKTDFFTLSGEKTNEINFDNDLESWKFFNDSKTYTEQFAPLDEALSAISKNQSEISILITDGELMLKKGRNYEESDLPWAKSQFINWLSLGNEIDCYVTDHIDEGENKHLFYLVFIPKALKSSPYLTTLENHIEKNYCETFQFTNNVFNIKTQYETSTSSGVNEILGLEEENYIKTADYEYLDLTNPWSEACEYLVEAFDENTGKQIAGGDYVLRNLFLEKIKNPLYEIEEIEIIVEDIQEDLKNLYCYNSCINSETIMLLDENTSKEELDLENNECIILNCREANGDIKKSKVYKKEESLPKIMNYFTFNQELFENSLQNGMGEIGIKLHPEKSDCYYEEKGETNIWKVSVVLKKCAPIDKEKLKTHLQKFVWEGKKIKTNDAMFQSFYGAILDASVNPENKVIYTYYIKSYN